MMLLYEWAILMDDRLQAVHRPGVDNIVANYLLLGQEDSEVLVRHVRQATDRPICISQQHSSPHLVQSSLSPRVHPPASDDV